MYMACVSGCFVGFPDRWHDIYKVWFTRFPSAVHAIRAVTLWGPPGSTSSPSPLWKNSKVSLDGQQVYRARQVLTDLILTGRVRAFGMEAWGISASPRRLTWHGGVEVQSQECSLTWRSWSRKGMRDLELCECVVLYSYMYQHHTALPRKIWAGM